MRKFAEYVSWIKAKPEPTCTEALKEILKWECVRGLAQKIANTPDWDVCYLFYNPDKVPVEIQRAVSDIIVADPGLGSAFRKNFIKNERYLDVFFTWFESARSFFPPDFVNEFSRDWEGREYTNVLKNCIKRECSARWMACKIETLMNANVGMVGRFLIEILLSDNFALLKHQLKECLGQRSVLHFWRTTKKFMWLRQATELQDFLMKQGVISNTEI